MKAKLTAIVLGAAVLSGCGMSKSQLRIVDGILEEAKAASCSESDALIRRAQEEIKKKIGE